MKRKPLLDFTNIFQKRLFFSEKYVEYCKRQKMVRCFYGFLVFKFVLLILLLIATSKISIELYKDNLEKKGIIYEQDLKMAYVLHSQEYNPEDLVALVKVIHGIINSADGKQRVFLEKTLPEAIRIQNNYAIPASAVLAQSIYESAYGQSELAKQDNNFFGLKALGKWEGEVVNRPTKDFDGTVNHIQPFRKFSTIYDGFKGWVDFIQQPRYKEAFKQTFDGEKFIDALLDGGYCLDLSYRGDINKIMARHGLKKLDGAIKKQYEGRNK